MKKIYTTLLLACLMTFSLHAFQIDSLKIIPTSPTSNDTIKVIAFTTHASSGCPLTRSSVEFIDDTIIVRASHTLGPWQTICHSTDTLILGMLEPGNYELHYHLMDTSLTVTLDIVTISFTVIQAIGIQHIETQNSEIVIYPIPATSEVTIKLPYSYNEYYIGIYSHLGQRIKAIYTRKNAISVNLSDVPDGIFYAVITDKYGRRWNKKIIKSLP